MPLLPSRERDALAAIAAPVRIDKDETLCQQNGPADAVFNLVQGVAKGCEAASGGHLEVSSFYFPGDLLGLAAQGRYVESVVALSPVIAYRLPLDALERLLRQEPVLSLALLCKALDRLRDAQSRTKILSRYDALGKVASFVDMLDRRQQTAARKPAAVYLPMRRSDIADYVGLSVEAVSRALTTLQRRQLLAFSGRRHFRVVDRAGLLSLISDAAVQPRARRARPTPLVPE